MAFQVGLFDTLGREVRAEEYSRQTINFEPAKDGGLVNLALTFPTAKQSWGCVAYLRLFDETGEVLLDVSLDVDQETLQEPAAGVGEMVTSQRHITEGLTLQIPEGAIAVRDESTVWDHMLSDDE